MTVGYNKPLYILPFDHRASFQTGLFGWRGALNPEQTARVAAAKQVAYEGLKAAVAAAAAVPGFIGFAVGRTSFWEPLVAWRNKQLAADQAAAEIAKRYSDSVAVFEQVRV